MFASLFKRSVPKAAAVPEGQVVFAIGDIHGRADLLRALVPAIWRDRGERDGKHARIIFLGDYIDRGPASDEVLDILLDLQGRAGVDWTFLRGNHEQALLDFIEDPEAGPAWGEWPLILTNGVCFILAGFILAMTLASAKQKAAICWFRRKPAQARLSPSVWRLLF